MLRTVTVTRYVTPLREGGSLPAIVEANDDGLYVLKFRGAGQGVKALIAELIAGELGRALGLPVPETLLASSIVWFDAYVTNVDRTPRNTNMLFWHRRLMLIDHGSSLYFHHNTGDFLSRSRSPFPPIKDHVLLPVASALEEADALMTKALSPENLQQTVNLIPGSWLNSDPFFTDRDAHREAYLAYLLDRLAASRYFVEEAKHARAQLL